MGLLDNVEEYVSRSGRNLARIPGDVLGLLDDWMAWREQNAGLLGEQGKAGIAATQKALKGEDLTDAEREAIVNSPAAAFGTADLQAPAGLFAGIVRNMGGNLRPPVSTEGMRPVFPQPQRLMPPEEMTPGGRYLAMPEKTDITGTAPSAARVEVSPEGKPSFKVSPDEAPKPPSKADGPTVKTNLFKQSAGWKWVDRAEGVPEVPTLVSVTTGGKHYYTLSAEFPDGVNLSRYADAPSEPRLRPTAYGDVELGPQVGTISVRGKQHPVYGRAVIVPKGRAEPPLPDMPILSTDPPDIPIGAAIMPGAPTFTNQFDAIDYWKANGGKNSGLRVRQDGPNLWTVEPSPSAGAVPPGGPVSGPVGPPASVPSAPGVANPGGPLVPNNAGAAGPGPGTGPAAIPPPFARSVPGLSPPVPVPAGALTDPEGRLLTAPLIAGIRQPGGPDVPLSMGEERWLANRLFNLGVYDDPNFKFSTGYNGQAGVMIPGGPNTLPMMRMTIDSRLSHDQYPKTFRHEGGHGLDFASERTNRTNKLPHSEVNNIPPDVQSELRAASGEMRPGLWTKPGQDVADYRQRSSELMADAYRYYKEDPQRFKALYPKAAQFIRDIINEDPLLSQHIQFNVMAPSPLGGLLAPADEERRP